MSVTIIRDEIDHPNCEYSNFDRNIIVDGGHQSDNELRRIYNEYYNALSVGGTKMSKRIKNIINNKVRSYEMRDSFIISCLLVQCTY